MEILSTNKLTTYDECFIKYINNYIKRYPFKWYHFMSLFDLNEVVYIKDTTIIIDLLKLDSSSIIILFEIFKDFLRNNIINKINYKKEVIIIDFYNDFMVSYFKNSVKWMLLVLLEILDDYEIEYYLDVFIKYHDEIIKYDCLMIYEGNYISIGINKSKKLFENHTHLVLNFYSNENYNLRFSFDKDKYFNNLLAHLRV